MAAGMPEYAMELEAIKSSQTSRASAGMEKEEPHKSVQGMVVRA
jgi:hypothetical protein